MMGLCYYDYLRIYTPLGAQLFDSSRQNIPASYFLSRQAVDSQAQTLEPEAGKSVFAQFFVVEPGKNWQAYLAYQLPSDAVQRAQPGPHGGSQYSLRIQKQSGKSAIPTVVTVNLPPGTKVVSTTPSLSQASALAKDKLQFEFLLTKDTYIEVRFRDSR
jgi:hypothetical protein